MKSEVKTKDTFEFLYENSNNPLVAKVISEAGELNIPERGFHRVQDFMARSIVGQQLSVAAARTIWGRVEKLAEQYGGNITECSISSIKEQIRDCGVSYNKIKALEALSEYFNKPSIEEELLQLSHKDRSDKLKKIWGVGQWTCDMTSIFYYRENDIWPLSDAGLKRGLGLILNKEVDNESFIEFGDTYRPYRSYMCLHLWYAADNQLVG